MNKIKSAFESIQAEDALKANTLRFLQAEIQKAPIPKKRPARLKIAFMSAAFAALLFFGGFSYNSYFTTTAFLDFDVNPSIEISVNRFGRVIEAYAYNSEGRQILSEIRLQHKTYQDATRLIVDAVVADGYLRDDAMISVTLQTAESDKESQILADVESNVRLAVSEHHITPQSEVFAVSAEVRNEAYGQDISPAKYLAILELQKVAPAATVDSCRDHTIGEIRALTQEHHDGASYRESGEQVLPKGDDSDRGHHGGDHH
ncbi:MAG: 1,4-alpha-glucan branching protein [Gracilibacteraceae bacterium]|jgi:hypothetical protein|nr:1,4-alpha-glucan branching protein [Gracilibacteraceae bacterium]